MFQEQFIHIPVAVQFVIFIQWKLIAKFASVSPLPEFFVNSLWWTLFVLQMLAL